MKILAIETATSFGGICILSDERIHAIVQLDSQITHSQRLMPTIRSVFEETGIGIEEIDAVAVSQGPGSFTGIRIGMSVAKSLAFAASKPIIAIPTLDAMVSRLNQSRKEPVCPVLDARRDEVYGAIYRSCDDAKFPERISDYLVLSINDLLESTPEDCLFFGAGVLKYKKEITDRRGDGAVIDSPDANFPCAISVATLALIRLRRGESDDLSSLEPIYIRKSDAELSRKKKKRESRSIVNGN